MKAIKKISLMMAICLLVGVVFVGCEKKPKIKDSEPVAKVGDLVVTYAEARFFAYMEQANYEAYYLSYGQQIDWDGEYEKGKTIEDLVKRETLDIMIKQKVMNIKAAEWGITLDDEAKATVEKNVNEFMKSSDKDLIKRIGATEALVRKVYEEVQLYTLACEKVLKDRPVTVTDEEAKQGLFTLCIVSGEAVDSPKDTAEAILARLKGGETVEYLANVYGVEKSSGNVGKGDFEGNSLETTCLSLKDGECGMAEVDGYYYVIFCDKSYDAEATKIAKEQKIKEKEDETITKYYEEIKSSYEVIEYEEVYANIKFSEPIFTIDDMKAQTTTKKENETTLEAQTK